MPRVLIVLAGLLMGCGDYQTLPDASYGWSDWGQTCNAPVYGIQTCTSAAGEIGWCINAGICVPSCATNAPRCPDGIECRVDPQGSEPYCWPK